MTTLECIFRSEPLTAPLKYHFSKYSKAKTGATCTTVQPKGMDDRPSEKAWVRMLTGIVDWCGTERVKHCGTVVHGWLAKRIYPRGVIGHVTARHDRSRLGRTPC
jgi:hypothetical protein